ncbi:hypothetical protein Salmuc_01745 [Salipiger mucosus DSM 16094]|uniref:Uncharacterized protein n=1 Tax=Salipiger mucosus DSM 16094 TaxID=1123237 RepID=S9S178_9RHOB|nr:hypothetical protein Salmuc_01745 [Salipiger mucosus DSM 16094]
MVVLPGTIEDWRWELGSGTKIGAVISITPATAMMPTGM